MKGYPKHLNSKEDVLYVKEHFEDLTKLKEFVKNLFLTAKGWFYVKRLTDESEGVTDDNHRITNEAEPNEEPRYVQEEHRLNPMAKIFKLRFTKAELRDLVEELGIADVVSQELIDEVIEAVN